MRVARSVSPLLLALLAAACGGRGSATLVVTGSGLTAVEGATVKLALVDVARRQIAQALQTTVSGGGFQVSLPVTSDTAYRVDVYADVDDDGRCQWGFDQVYAIDVSGVSERATKTVTIDRTVTTDSRGCLSFGASSLHVTASSIQVSAANPTYWVAALVRCAAQGADTCSAAASKTAGILNGTPVNGRADFVFEGGIVPGYFYRVNIYVNELIGITVPCSSAPVMMSKVSVQLPGPLTEGLTGDTVDMAMDPASNPAGTEICASFPPS